MSAFASAAACLGCLHRHPIAAIDFFVPEIATMLDRVVRSRSLSSLVVLFAATFGCLTTIAQDVPLVAPGGALTPAEQQKLFRLPPGFKIQLIASEPEIQK
ncbi:MAG: hypothetical protein NT069_28755, partial [Planctomycetota bacterium]|nr:hypothetical protein [Planctomycetota bacterium]